MEDMQEYTVIGLYQDTGKVLLEHVEAEGPHIAMALISKKFLNEELEILGAAQGHVKLTAACEDSFKAAYTLDVAGLLEDDEDEEVEEEYFD